MKKLIIERNSFEWQTLFNSVFNFTKWVEHDYGTEVIVDLRKALNDEFGVEDITKQEFVDFCCDFIKDSRFCKKINDMVNKYVESKKENKNINKINESFDDDFKSKTDWFYGEDKTKLNSILDGMTIDEVQEYLGYWWVLEYVNASKGIYTFTRPSWGNIMIHTKKNKVQFVESTNKKNKSLKENGSLFSHTTPYEIKVGNKKVPSNVDYEVTYDRIEGDEYVLGIEIKGVGKTQLRFDSKNEAKELGWILESKKSSHKSLTEKRISTEDKIEALAEYKGVDIEEVEEGYDENHFEVDGEEYIVADYDTAYDLAVEYSEQIFDDLGLESVTESTQEYFLENEEYCSYPWEDDMHESNLVYAQDIDSESGSSGYATRLVEEAIDRKVIKEKDCFENEDGELDYEDKDELAEMLADDMDDDYSSMSEYFESIYGRGWASEMKDTLENYLDYRAMAEYVVDMDGIANSLAGYDGKEHTEKVNGVELYIYRTN